MSVPEPDFVKAVALVLLAATESMVRFPELFWNTIRSPPLAPLIVPPVIVFAPVPVANKPPEERVKILPPLIVTVDVPASLRELIDWVPTFALGLPVRLTLFAATHVAGFVPVVYAE